MSTSSNTTSANTGAAPKAAPNPAPNTAPGATPAKSSAQTAIRTWSDIDRSILKGLPNPSGEAYEIKIKIPEFTFLGVREQPDFAVIYLTFYPGKKIIELRSLKHYVYQLRNTVVSYERLINIIYDDLVAVFEPERLRIVMICNPRGGISSKLTIDSDWKARGGKEAFSDWQSMKDEWDVKM